MTTHELVPILKALHADHHCAPILADWFEERDDLPTADVLRWGQFDNGTQLVRTLVWGNRHYTKPGAPQLTPIRRNVFCETAVIEDAMSRINWYELGNTDPGLDQDLRHTRGATEYLLGTQPTHWVRIPHNDGWDWNRGQHYTCVSPDGERAQRITMRLVRLKWEPPLVTLCGGWLELTMSVWVGTDPFTGRPIVTYYDKSLARDPVLKELPF